MSRSISLLATLLLVFSNAGAAELPHDFFAEFCFDCHQGASSPNGIDLHDTARFSGAEVITHRDSETLQRVLKVIAQGLMPPEDAPQPVASRSEIARAEVHEFLIAKSPIGGTLIRRLSRREYEATIESIFGFDYELPNSFPEDRMGHGFDNSAEGLVVSAPLMESYFHSAIQVADTLLPPPSKPVKSTRTHIPAEDLVISYSSGALIDGTMRLAFDWDVMFRSTTWPEKWEAIQAGKYKIQVAASQLLSSNQAYPAFDGPMKLEVRARSLNTKDGEPVSKQRLLATFEVCKDEVEVFELEAELYPNETPIFYFSNGPVPGEKGPLAELTLEMFQRDARLYAGWKQAPQSSGGRGGLGWERVKAIRDGENIDLSSLDTSDQTMQELAKKLSSNPGNYGETMVFQFYEEGPALELHAVTIEGPLEIVQTPDEKIQIARSKKFFGDQAGRATEQYVTEFFDEYLSKLFRRPASSADVNYYSEITLSEAEKTGSLDNGLHLGIRTSLMSPYFLYRGHETGELNGYDLAARLAYFLTNEPPDAELRKAAAHGALTETAVLTSQAQRLLKDPRSKAFVGSFVGQWLEIDQLADIMPDARLIEDFTVADHESMVQESEMFFTEILAQNLPMKTFIRPEFTFMNERLATHIYGIEGVTGKNLNKTALPPNSPYGGLLGQASIMMATANGVDTMPVTRGVWVLENILGDRPPEPPENVPAITPDTSNSKTVRELLAAHRADDACASCHRSIDPLGFVLENFDPIGRWRTSYPLLTEDDSGNPTMKEGLLINASGNYKDGTPLNDINDLKQYVVANIDQFSNCLAQKLLQYGTGRSVSYAEKIELESMIAQHREANYGFRDLLLGIIQSKAFRTK